MKKNRDQQLQQAVALYSAGKLKEAETLVRHYLAHHKHDADAIHIMGMIALKKGSPETAFKHINAAAALDAQNPTYHFHLGVTLEQLNRDEEAVNAYRKAITLHPALVEAYINMGNIFFRRAMWESALKFFMMVLKIKPNHLDALINIANTYKQLGALADAEEWYGKALALEPNAPVPYNNLGNIRFQTGKLKEAEIYYKQAIELKPDYVDAVNNFGNLLKKMGRYDEALEYYDRALGIDPANAGIHMNRAHILLLLRRFPEGWSEYEWRLQVKEGDERQWRFLQQLKKPLWDGSDAPDKRLLVHTEQGIGDAVQFIRFLPEAKKKVGSLVLVCHEACIALFRDFTGDGFNKIIPYPADNKLTEPFDLHIPLLSLPHVLKLTELDIINTAAAPYIDVNFQLQTIWRNKVIGENPQRINVGIVWAGNPNHHNDHNRSCSLNQFGLLGEVLQGEKDYLFFSLQKGEAEAQLKSPPAGLKNALIHLGAQLTRFSDTAAVIMNLDLVITVDTAVAHLAGALGQTVWMPIPFDPDWRWMLNRYDTPWYPSMRLFRQKQPGEWEPVFQEILEELKHFEKTTLAI